MNIDSVTVFLKHPWILHGVFFSNVKQVNSKPKASQSPYNSFPFPSFYQLVLNPKNTQRHPKPPQGWTSASVP